MEKYLIIKTEKEKYLKDYPVLECEHSIGIDYDGYISIKCKNIIFNEIIDVASGRKQTLAEKYKIYNDFCIFNPAPIT